MINALRLLLPALLPSWRFFPEVGPSPRIEYSYKTEAESEPDNWIPFGGRPEAQTLVQSIKNLFWNPEGNASLFAVTCCEQFLANNSQQALEHLLKLVREEAISKNGEDTYKYFQWRLYEVFREGTEIKREEVYRSEVLLMDGVLAS